MTGAQVPIFETDRLRIRPFMRDDLDACHALLDIALGEGLRADERCAWLSWSAADDAQLARLYQPPYGDRAIVLLSSGAWIGVCGLVPSLGPLRQLPSRGGLLDAPNEPEVGLYGALSPAHRGRGYAAEAARALVEHAKRRLRLSRRFFC